MCKALEDLYREGEEKGRENALRGIIEKKLEKGYSISEIADILEEDESVIKSIIGA